MNFNYQIPGWLAIIITSTVPFGMAIYAYILIKQIDQDKKSQKKASSSK